MPKDPIRTRTALYVPLRDGTLMRYPWNLVTTSVGTMLELDGRSIRGQGSGLPSGMTNEDVYETNFTDVKILSLADLAAFGAAGALGGGDVFPKNYNVGQ